MYYYVRKYIRMRPKKSVTDLKKAELKGKRVFVRADLDVPMDDDLEITDDTKIQAAVPTLKYLMNCGARVILASHLDFPDGVEDMYSLKHIVQTLSKLLGVEVKLAGDCIGPEVERMVADMLEGGILLLENLRFHDAEYLMDPDFVKKLASIADLFVNDAFGIAHMPIASTSMVVNFLKPCVTGILMDTELRHASELVAADPQKPVAAIVGGLKLSTKFGLLESLLERVNSLFLGGAMIFTFYKASGYSVGSSLVEELMVHKANLLLRRAKVNGVSLYIPDDVVIADKFAASAEIKVVRISDNIPDSWMGLDIGPSAIDHISMELDKAETIFWNGPMGVFEYDKFAKGTEAIAKRLAESGKKTIIGGGDTVAAVVKMKLAHKMTHVSTGGDAFLELLQGRELPTVLCLDDASQN